jgi:hypothetical protein
VSKEMQDRRTSHVIALRKENTIPDHVMTLFFYVRDSGKFNMYTEADDVLVYALVFGVYCGLLQYPNDFYHSCFDRLDLLYCQWLRPESSKRLEEAARMLPSGEEFNAMIESFADSFPGQPAPDSVEAMHLLEAAFFSMRWMGKYLHFRNVKAVGKKVAEEIRHRELVYPLPLKPRSTQVDDLDMLHGLVHFREFIRLPEQRKLLEAGVEQELLLKIDLSDTLSVEFTV